jgi:hypothetical protein
MIQPHKKGIQFVIQLHFGQLNVREFVFGLGRVRISVYLYLIGEQNAFG